MTFCYGMCQSGYMWMHTTVTKEHNEYIILHYDILNNINCVNKKYILYYTNIIRLVDDFIFCR